MYRPTVCAGVSLCTNGSMHLFVVTLLCLMVLRIAIFVVLMITTENQHICYIWLMC